MMNALEFLVGASLFFDFLLVTIVIPISPSLMNARRAGILFAAKPLAQVLCNPVIAHFFPTSNAAVLRAGVALGGFSASAFGFTRNYRILILWRCVQGAASAAVMTGGMSLLLGATSEQQRSQSTSRAFMGLTLGVCLGPVIGGIGKDTIGHVALFETCAAAMAILAIAQHVLIGTPAPSDKQGQQSVEEDGEQLALQPLGASESSLAKATVPPSRSDGLRPPAPWLDGRVLSAAMAMLVVSLQAREESCGA